MNDDGVDSETAGPVRAQTSRAQWEVPELVAAGAVLASVAVFIGFTVAGIYTAFRTPSGTFIGMHYGTTWIIYTVPLTLLATLAAWSVRTGTVRWRRLRPCLAGVATLSVLTVAGAIASLAYTLAIFSTRHTGRAADLSANAGICVMAVVAGVTLWLAARRLLRRADSKDVAESPPAPA